MRDKNLFQWILGLNLALALAFVIYLVLSSHRNPKVISTAFPQPGTTVTNTAVLKTLAPSPTNVARATPGSAPEPRLVAGQTNTLASTNLALAKPVPAGKQFTWKEVTNDTYQGYLDNLRLVGCPEDKIRYIILQDINQCIDQKRLQESIAHDTQWWKAEANTLMVNVLQEKGRALEEERIKLIGRWLGEEVAEKEKDPTELWNNVQLSGPVLGKLSKHDHQVVQEICANSMERYQGIFWDGVNNGRTMNQLELAKLRQGTRSELVKTLSPDAMEEFLLRYSHNANQLRQELAGLDPTPEEFRRIFRETDPLDHAMQLEYGGLETLSPEQRDRHNRQRDDIIRKVLGPARYEGYLLTKDPLFRQAQLMARQYGAPPSVVKSIYEMTKAHELRRQQIMQDGTLSAQQKQKVLQSVFQEQQTALRKLATDAAGQP